MATYVLHPSLWRKIRKNHSGSVRINLSNGSNIIIFRYDPLCSYNGKFSEIDFKEVLEKSYGLNCGVLQGNDIPIGCSYF